MEDGQEGDHLTDALTTKAIKFMNDHKDQQFYLNLCYYTVHTPVTAKDKIKKYETKLKDAGITKQSPGIKV